MHIYASVVDLGCLEPEVGGELEHLREDGKGERKEGKKKFILKKDVHV